MYKVCFISRLECFIQKDQVPGVELEPYGNTVDIPIFKNILNQALSTPPNLLILHPPSGVEVDEVITILKEHSTRSMATIFITSAPRELDIWYKGFGHRCVQIPESLLERIWDSLISTLSKSKGAYDLFASLLECTIELSDQVIETVSTACEDKIEVEDDPHNMRNIYGPREVLRLAHGSYLSEEVIGLIDLLDERIHEQRSLGPDVPIMSITDLSKGIIPPLGRVLMIDDEHSRGWSTVFGALIFGRTDIVYKVTPLPKENSNAQEFLISHWESGIDQRDAVVRSACELAQEFQEGLFAISEIGVEGDFVKTFLQRRQIGEYQRELIPFDVILLDYRLRAEGREVPPCEVSGYKLSAMIHKLDPSIPIIVVSASDKVWTLLNMRNVGAWDYYLKPGVSSGGSSATDEYGNQDLKKMVIRLGQTAESPWIREFSMLNEWMQHIRKLKKGSSEYRLFISDNFDFRNVIAKAFSIVSDNLMELSRLAIDEETEDGLGKKTTEHSMYVLAQCWESQKKYLEKYYNSHAFLNACYKIARTYRNMISHEHLPKQVPDQYHLRVQALCLASFLPRILTWSVFPKPRDQVDGELLVSKEQLTDTLFKWLDTDNNHSDTRYFNQKPHHRNPNDLPDPYWYEKLPKSRLGKLDVLSARLEKNFNLTKWVHLVTYMLIALYNREYCVQSSQQSSVKYIPYCEYVEHIFCNTVHAILNKYAI